MNAPWGEPATQIGPKRASSVFSCFKMNFLGPPRKAIWSRKNHYLSDLDWSGSCILVKWHIHMCHFDLLPFRIQLPEAHSPGIPGILQKYWFYKGVCAGGRPHVQIRKSAILQGKSFWSRKNHYLVDLDRFDSPPARQENSPRQVFYWSKSIFTLARSCRRGVKLKFSLGESWIRDKSWIHDFFIFHETLL